MDSITTGGVSAEQSGGGADTTRPGMDALNPRTWDSQDLFKFLQLNEYHSLVEPCCGLTGLQVVSLNEEAVKAIKLDSSTISSLVDLINYFRVLAAGASFDIKQVAES